MSGAGFPPIPKHALLDRFAEGRAARVAVVTPNQRLAAALTRDFDSQQLALGRSFWEAADILPFSALVERLYEDALYSGLATQVPILLSTAQEQAQWEEVIRATDAGAALLSETGAAALAREAWQLAHAWRLLAKMKSYPANDDSRAFGEWAWRYEGITARDRHTDRARLPDVVAANLAHAALKKPDTLVAYGFDIVTPQQREFLAALGGAGIELFACGPEPRTANVRRVAYTSAKDEIHAAASWARSKLETARGAHFPLPPGGGGAGGEGDAYKTPFSPGRGAARGERGAYRTPRIGIVVPDLRESRNTVRRIFAEVVRPARPLPRVAGDGQNDALPFNLSLGEPLTSYALVSAAFLALDLARDEIGFPEASRLIRSPFIAGAESECAGRARLDADLRRTCGARLSLDRLCRAIVRATDAKSRHAAPACPVLLARLEDLAGFVRENLSVPMRPGEWGRAISGLLGIIGFPGERSLDSAEYQTLKKFHEAIASFAALDRVAARMSFAEACASLERIAAGTLFQPEAPEVPIQVLGVLESAGLEFDHLWVMGLTDEAWPIPARPNPFVPLALQRAAGVPESSAAASLDLDERITRGWLAAAGEVVLSHALREDDRELAPSPLIRSLPCAAPDALALPAYESLREAIRRARREQRLPDFQAPPVAAGAIAAGSAVVVAGGTGVFADQADCPFRAFAVRRLDAQGLEAPPQGLDARDRGTLLHAMLARLWSDLKSKAHLDAASASDLDALLAKAADVAIGRLRWRRPEAMERRFEELERARLVALGREWLELEKKRRPFDVAAVEQKRAVSFGGISVNARLDRMDRLEGGAHAVLDYKTGNANVADWLGPRPEEPQLPLYALSGGEDIAAVAFAQVKTGEMELKGIARDAGLMPGVKTIAEQRSRAAKHYVSWNALLAGWKQELDALGRGFASGDARVDPKLLLETCSYCEVKPFCRIYERMNVPILPELPLAPDAGEGVTRKVAESDER